MIATTVKENYSLEKLTEFRRAFLAACTELGKNMSVHSEMLIETIPVDVADWAEQMGEYTLIKEHGRGHIIVSFMATKYEVPKLEEDKEKGKLVVPVKSIVADQELKFNAYIYMDKNKKYLTYGKDGRSLSSKQLDKLLSAQKNLYIRKQDAELFKRYFASNVVNDLIDFYLKNETDKAG
ncbi:MAG: hypothetical protein KDD40_04255 [Bdellovibrionales bacterium]|nr:hypothetical protein [Bdellovibrionales bacterium]